MKGQKVAIFGLGRSGLAIGKAVLAIGGSPHVFDETALSALPKREVFQEAEQVGLPVTLGWSGEFTDRPWDLVVVNPAIPRTHPKLKVAQDHGLQVISEVEFAYLISKAPIVAITGTNGKSTTSVMTMLCLRACGEDAVLCGNIFGSGYGEVPLTEAALHSTLDQILVAEISSFQLEWVSRFKPAVAGVTNISPDHLDRYAGFEEYAATKLRIFANQGPGEFAVAPADDPLVIAPEGPVVLSVGRDAWVSETELVALGRRVSLLELPFGEPHNLANACMAALLAYGALRWKADRDGSSHAAALLAAAEREGSGQGVDDSELVRGLRESRGLPQQIVEGLKQFRGLAHRMESVGEKDGIRVINNSMCTNPEAVIKSAQAVRGRSHLLIGGVNKGLDFGPLAEFLANHENRVYLFGSDAVVLDNMLGGGHPTFATMSDAFHAALLEARPQEVVMLAPGCASTDQFRDFRDRGEKFKSIAKEWLDS